MQKQNNNIATAKKWQTIEATIIDVIVAFIIVIAIIFTTKIIFGKQIKKAIEVVDMISIKTDSSVVPEIKFDTEKSTITNYPEYGSRYGNIKIESLDINLPLYYGDKLSILKNGVGQSSGSYFPGEGGSIICMGHNTKAFLYKLPQIKKGAIIEVETTYGTFKYKVDNTKIVINKITKMQDKNMSFLFNFFRLLYKLDDLIFILKKSFFLSINPPL